MVRDNEVEGTSARPSMFYTIPELARAMKLSYNGVYKMIREGSIPAIKFGRVYRIKAEEAHRIFDKGVTPCPPS